MARRHLPEKYPEDADRYRARLCNLRLDTSRPHGTLKSQESESVGALAHVGTANMEYT